MAYIGLNRRQLDEQNLRRQFNWRVEFSGALLIQGRKQRCHMTVAGSEATSERDNGDVTSFRLATCVVRPYPSHTADRATRDQKQTKHRRLYSAVQPYGNTQFIYI
jgi:hypothetical protein